MCKKKWYWYLSISLLLVVPINSRAQSNKALADAILTDSTIMQVKAMASNLVESGFTAGTGYGEVWIRDFNTFVALSCVVMPADTVKDKLRKFFQMQGKDGNIIDGYIPKNKAQINYAYIYNNNAPDLAGHKNTVETDQETSLIQAVYKYIKSTNDHGFLKEMIDGKNVQTRMRDALMFLMEHRFSKKYGLIYGATTADWGDVQPESPWGVVIDSNSHFAIDIYDNAMLLIAIHNYVEMVPGDKKWAKLGNQIKENVRKFLWDKKKQKFIPHIYLNGSPFPADFDENKILYYGGSAIAIAADLLRPAEIREVNRQMVAGVKASGAMSIGLTLYPTYPEGYFKNKGMYPYGYQNGGDWTWFGGRMITQLVRNGFAEEAYKELRPMIDRVLANKGFYEWYSIDGKPSGSGDFRGSAGVLYEAITALQHWAGKQAQ